MERLTWEQYFMNMAILTAMRSADPSTKCGAVLVDENNTVISTGYNGYPRRVSRDIESDDRETKYKWVVHAEANAIHNATRQGKPLDGATLYVTWPPCHECAKMIAQVGIKKVVFVADRATQRWQGSFEQTVEVFSECGVQFIAYQQPTEPLILQRFISGKTVV